MRAISLSTVELFSPLCFSFWDEWDWFLFGVGVLLEAWISGLGVLSASSNIGNLSLGMYPHILLRHSTAAPLTSELLLASNPLNMSGIYSYSSEYF